MRAPLALGILTWDDVLAGFSASGVCAWVLRRGPLGERQDVSAKTFLKCTAGQKTQGGQAGTRGDIRRGESHPCAERIFYGSTDV